MYHAECAVFTASFVLLALALLLNHLERDRRGLKLRNAMLAAFSLRAGLALALQAVPSTAAKLRGPDDAFFLFEAKALASMSPSTWAHHLLGDLVTAVLAAHTTIFSDPGELSMRFIQIAFAVGGILFVAAAAYEIAGARAAALAAWIATLEPSGLFFASMAQKESLTMLGEGILAFGCARMWRSLSWRSAGVIGAGVALIAAARPYAGLFAALGAIAVLSAAYLGRLGPELRLRAGMVIAAVTALAIAIALISPFGRGELTKLQRFQNEGAANSRLQLEPVDFSSITGLAVGLPQRVQDYLLKPYPWQQQDASQRFAAIPTVLAWLLILLALWPLATRPRAWLRRAPPLALPALLVTFGYALTTANAGTGFRHRTPLLLLLAGLIGIVWADSLPSWLPDPAVFKRQTSPSQPAAS